MATVTWDASNKGANVVLTNNNLTASGVNSNNGVRATLGRLAGKWYWEIEIVVVSYARIGIVSSDNLNKRLYDCEAKKQPENTAYGSTYAVGNIIGIALDLDNGLLEFYKNGVSQGVSHTNIKALGEVFPYMTTGYSSAGSTTIANFGATPFKYPMPKGYYSYDSNQGWSNKFLISSDDMKSILSARNYKKHTVVNTNIESVESSYGYSTSTADKLFDNNNSTLWNSYQDDANGKTFVTIKLKEKNVIDSVAFKKISMITSGSYGLKGFKILASNDNINFVELFSGQNPNNDVDSSYSFNNKKAYLYYKFESLDSWLTGKRVIFGELEYSLKKDVVEELVSMVNLSEKDFINHGMNKPLELDLSAEISTRTFIEQSPTTLGSGKVFKKSIDTSQVSIKKVTIK